MVFLYVPVLALQLPVCRTALCGLWSFAHPNLCTLPSCQRPHCCPLTVSFNRTAGAGVSHPVSHDCVRMSWVPMKRSLWTGRMWALDSLLLLCLQGPVGVAHSLLAGLRHTSLNSGTVALPFFQC